MLEQRLQQRLRLLLSAPTVIVLLIAALAVTTARTPGVSPREDVFDIFERLSPRPTNGEPAVAVIDIDAESVKRLGPWPWPRTALAELLSAAEEAGAASVTLAVPVEGPDPLSPEVVGRYWLAAERMDDAVARAIAELPSTNVPLAASATGVPTAFGVAARLRSTTEGPVWLRTDVQSTSWLEIAGDDGTGFLALPAAGTRAPLPPMLAEAGIAAVIGLPADKDGTVRAVPLLFSADGVPAPAATLAPLALTQTVIAAPARGRLRVGGTPVAAIGAGSVTLPLGPRGEMRLWLPGDLDVPTVPAWRALGGEAQWTQPLAGKAVFVGYGGDAGIKTARGTLPLAQLHALGADQAIAGRVPVRPGWAGGAEGLAALALGALAVAAAVFTAPAVAGGLTLLLTAATFGLSYLSFRSSGVLIDPVPIASAMIGGQLGVLAVVLGNMLLRDDAVRGAFHGAIPPKTMDKLQSRGGQRLLRGTRREVTVLSCALRLPPRVTERFEGRPDDFVRFQASANDALRRTILAHEGTVDHAENGQLLGYWNVPEEAKNHIEHACACALRMIDDVNALSENVEAAALSGDGSVDAGFAEGVIEIGIASAPSFAGPVGLGSRNRYAVVGDAVALASRLRARSPLYGPAIITDDVVFDALRHHYAFLDLDIVQLGLESQMRGVYGLVGNPFLKASKAFRQLADTQRELLLAWRAGDLAGVTRQLQHLRGLPGVPDAYVALFEQRLGTARVEVEGRPWNPADMLVL